MSKSNLFMFIMFIPIIIVLLAVYLFTTPKLYTVKLYSSSGKVIRQWNAVKFRAGGNMILLKDGNKKVFICGNVVNVVAEEYHANNNY